MKIGKYSRHAIMVLCYGASPAKTARDSKLGLRRAKVILKQLKKGNLPCYADFRGRNYRGYKKARAPNIVHAMPSIDVRGGSLSRSEEDYFIC
tara:strand:+ start:10465 stop:10743 length:279 start_codon:yes stop_codon:yes gene_type:complete